MRNLLWLAAVVAVVIALSFWESAPPAPPPTAPAPDYPAAPDFAFTTLDGATHHLSDFRGQVVVLNFWASWCAPCQEEFPALLKLAQDYRGRLVLIALSVDHEAKAMNKFLAKLKPGPEALIAHDPTKAIVQDLYQTIRVPETILIAPDGTLRHKFAGAEDWAGAEMRATVESLF